MNKKIVGGIAATTILFGGGISAADNMINPYDTVGNTLQIASISTLPEGGTEKIIADKTQPKITLQKFSGEVSMGVTYQGMTTTGDRPFLSKNVEWSDANQTMQVVPLEASSTYEDGGIELNIVLNSAPASNVFNFSIDGTDQLDFFYQAPLWQEAGLKAPTKDCTDTDCTTAEGTSHRPDNVVGSFAVYYKNHANHKVGSTNYATGKAYHIFRPLATDANGATIWADLSYTNGVLTVIVSQDFLDSAIYPVIVDPTFGYTTLGASSGDETGSNYLVGVKNTTQYTASSGDTIVSYSTGGKIASGSGTEDVTAYTFSGGLPVTRLAAGTSITVNSSTGQFFTSSAVSQSLSAGTVYVVAQCNFGSGVFSYWDTGAGSEEEVGSGTGACPASYSHLAALARIPSIYATYTAGATAAPPAKNYIKGAKGYIKGAKGYTR